MAKQVDIVALGELLIDFTEAGQSKDGRRLFEQNPGGAPANLLTVASHMGIHGKFSVQMYTMIFAIRSKEKKMEPIFCYLSLKKMWSLSITSRFRMRTLIWAS